MNVAVQNNAKILALFAIACTALVSVVHWLTKDTIVRQQQQQLLNTLYEVIPTERLNNDLYHDCQIIAGNEYLGSNDEQNAYIARMDNKPIAVAITSVAPNGYNGKIKLVVALNIDGSVSGARVLKHQETPGLGDKIETRKNDWIYSFNGKKVETETDSRWAVKKDGGIFDQFTGATITPRAVVKAVKNTAIYFNINKQTILSAPTSTCRDNND